MNRYERKGEDDARRGITACDLDEPGQRRHWARGHDRAFRAGEGPLPRFGLICRRSASVKEALEQDRQLGEDRGPTHGSLIWMNADLKCEWCGKRASSFIEAKRHQHSCPRLRAIGFDLECQVRNGRMTIEQAEQFQAMRPDIAL